MMLKSVLQLSPAEPLPTANAMFASHGYIIESTGLVRRVEFPTMLGRTTEIPLALGPLWIRANVFDGMRIKDLPAELNALANIAGLKR